jgi:NNP family nitrate/nitrite transporter-like MFS transporter
MEPGGPRLTVDGMLLRELRRAGHAPSLVAALLHFDVSFMAWVLLGALGAYIGEDLGLSASAKGLMVAVPLLSAAFFRVLLGLLGDRYGPRRIGLMSMGVVVAALTLGWLGANTYGALLGVGVLLGVAGASFAVALPLAGRHFPPRHQGLAMGIAGAGNSGTVLTTLAAPRLAEHVGWHAVFGLALVPVVLVWGAFALLAKEPPAPQRPVTARDLAGLTRSQDAWRLCGLYAVTFGTFVGLASFLPIFFHDQYGISKVDAATIVAAGGALGSLLRPLGGHLADRAGAPTVLTAVYGVAAALLLFTSALPALGAAAAAFVLTMGACGVGNGAVFQLVGVRFAGRVGIITGVVGAAGGLGGFFLPTLLGTARDAFGSYGPGIGVVAAAALVAMLAILKPRAALAEARA